MQLQIDVTAMSEFVECPTCCRAFTLPADVSNRIPCPSCGAHFPSLPVDAAPLRSHGLWRSALLIEDVQRRECNSKSLDRWTHN